MTKDAVTAIVRRLNEAGVRYLIAGGFAVIVHGYSRLTVDLDLILDLEPENVLRAMQCLKEEGYRPKVPVPIEQFSDESLREMWAEQKGMVAFALWSDKHRETFVDIFIRAPFDFERAYAERFNAELVPDLQATFVSLQDLLFLKREASRPKDLQDIYYLQAINEEKR